MDKKWKAALLFKENEIVKDTQLYAGRNMIAFTRKHNVLLRNAMRQFFKNAVYPTMMEIVKDPDSKYDK